MLILNDEGTNARAGQYIGLDTIKALCERWSLDATALDDLIENGCYGRKSGAGFYQYSGVGSDQIKL